MGKRKLLFLVIAIGAFMLGGCAKELTMDQPAADGNYHYHNKSLNFTLVLPSEFIYYQTQRKQAEGFVDIEFFVPTADLNYPQEVPGYAKPIVIRVFNQDYWKNNSSSPNLYKKLSEKGGRVYTIKLWQNIPKDWKSKWSQKMGDNIIKSFKLD